MGQLPLVMEQPDRLCLSHHRGLISIWTFTQDQLCSDPRIVVMSTLVASQVLTSETWPCSLRLSPSILMDFPVPSVSFLLALELMFCLPLLLDYYRAPTLLCSLA